MRLICLQIVSHLSREFLGVVTWAIINRNSWENVNVLAIKTAAWRPVRHQDPIIKGVEKPMAVLWRSEPVDIVARYFYVKTKLRGKTALLFSDHRYEREVPSVVLKDYDTTKSEAHLY